MTFNSEAKQKYENKLTKNYSKYLSVYRSSGSRNRLSRLLRAVSIIGTARKRSQPIITEVLVKKF